MGWNFSQSKEGRRLAETRAPIPPRKEDRADELNEIRTHLSSVSNWTDYEVWNDGAFLADMECRHGKMAHDRIQTCDCFRLPIERLPADLLDRLRESRRALERPPNGRSRALSKLVSGRDSVGAGKPQDQV